MYTQSEVEQQNKMTGTESDFFQWNKFTNSKPIDRYIDAEHGVVCRIPNERFGYFGWPTVTRMNDRTLIVASSGLRLEHICPFGKTVINISRDNGKTWSEPRVIQNSSIDDRDAGICSWRNNNLLVSWFRSDTRLYRDHDWIPEVEREEWDKVFSSWTDEMVEPLLGSWLTLSNDGGETWSESIRTPVSAPHGPIVLCNGDLLYLGKRYAKDLDKMRSSPIFAARSSNGGRTWRRLGSVPLYPGTSERNYYEPHVVELSDGKLIGMIRFRFQNYEDSVKLKDLDMITFSMMQTESTDGGNTWTKPRPLNFHGSPPHIIRHSSGVLVLTCGCRLKPFGQRVAFSKNNGQTWKHNFILRDDGPDGDLGYPSTVELGNGSLFSVYYQKAATEEKCSLLWSKWRLPEISSF